jgi:hypothetical protein
MPDLVCTGAALQCSFGTASATFSAAGTRISAGTAAGAVSDTAASNVPPFGQCTSLGNPQVNSATQGANGILTPQPCQPVLTGDWTPGSVRVKIGPAAALDSASQCTCSYGGVITVTSAGQSAATLA